MNDQDEIQRLTPLMKFVELVERFHLIRHRFIEIAI